MENADREQPKPERKQGDVDEEEVEAVERGEAEAGSRREEVERAAEREEEAGEG